MPTTPPPCCGGDPAPTRGHVSRRTLLRGATIGGAAVVAGVTLPPLVAAAAPPLYNPFAGRTITQTWEQHRANGSLGGIDFAMPVGTPLPACGAGVVSNNPNNGTGGYTVTIDLGGGWRSQYLHLSQFIAAGTTVAQGQTAGYSGGAKGAPGAGSSTGPHVHWHLIDPNNVRVNPLNYLSGGGPSAPGWAFNPPDSSMQARIQSALKARGRYSGPVDGAWGVNTRKGIQTTIKNVGYTGAVDGVPGHDTCYYVQVYAKKFGSYTGPVDAVLGPNSWAGFALGLERP